MLKSALYTVGIVLLASTGAWAQSYRTQSGTLTTTGSVEMSAAEMGTVSVQIAGSMSGGDAITFEVSNNRTTWYPIKLAPPDSATSVSSTTSLGIWSGS